MITTTQITKNIIEVLIRLHNEAKEQKMIDNKYEYVRRSYAIAKILNMVENDFDLHYMLHIFKLTCDKLGDTLGPLSLSIIQKLIKNGFEIEKVKSVLQYKKNI
jgi:hypothetical protein